MAVPQSLSDVVHLSLLEREEPDRVVQIWNDYHSTAKSSEGADSSIVPNALGRTLDKAQAAGVLRRATECPIFVLPVWRQDGYMVMLSQFADAAYNFVYLEDFKTQPHAAEPYMAARMYRELVTAKGVVLVRAHIDGTRLHRSEAEQLLDSTLRVYSDDALFEFVETFNKRPADFDFEAFVQRAKEEGIGAESTDVGDVGGAEEGSTGDRPNN